MGSGVTVDQLRDDIERLNGDVLRAQYIEGMATRSAAAASVEDVATGGRAGSDTAVDQMPDYSRARREFSPLRALARELSLRRESGLEDEVMAEMRSRDGIEYEGVPVPREAMALRADITSAAATGGGLIGTEHRPQNFIEALRSRLVMGRVGATVLDNLMGAVSIPGQSAVAAAGWAADNAAVAQADPVFLSKAMAAKKVGMYTSVTREVIRQANPDVERLIMADFAAGIAQALDSAALVGGGAAEPSGVGKGVVQARTGVTTNGLALTRRDLFDMLVAVDGADAPEDSRAWVMNTQVMGKLYTIPAGTVVGVLAADSDPFDGGEPMLDPNAPRDMAVLLGDRVVRSNLVRSNLTKGTGKALSELFYGNWSGLLIGYWGGLDLLPNPYESAAYKAGNVLIRGLLNADVVVRNASEFAFYNDLITTIA